MTAESVQAMALLVFVLAVVVALAIVAAGMPVR